MKKILYLTLCLLISITASATVAGADVAKSGEAYGGETPKDCFPHLGTPKVLVVLAEFNDVKFSLSTKTDKTERDAELKAIFNDYLNAPSKTARMGGNMGSVKQYFTDISFGKFSPQFDIYGICTLPQDLAYYGGTANERMNHLFTDVATWLNQTGQDFSQYDADNDGKIDLIHVIYAGHSASETGQPKTCIWPKSSYNPCSSKISGKAIWRYGVNNEMVKDHIEGIGPFCHEFSHCLGLPDMYAENGAPMYCINQAPGSFSLMDVGCYAGNEGCSPTAMTAWERERLDWLEIEDLNTYGEITLAPLDETGNPDAKAYRIRPFEGSTEYYLVENLQKIGWNRGLYAHGLAVWHINYDEEKFGDGKPNSITGQPFYCLLPANGMLVPEYMLYRTISYNMLNNATVDAINEPFYAKYNGTTYNSEWYSDLGGVLYPGNASVTSITDKAILYSGGTLGKSITDITEKEGIITFNFMDSPSSIDYVTEKTSFTQDDHTYNLSGQKVGKDYKGIVIKQGKKILLH